MLNVTPVPADRGYALPLDVLAALGLEHMARRRFLTPSDALRFVLTVRW
jgi:hypothetical protein